MPMNVALTYKLLFNEKKTKQNKLMCDLFIEIMYMGNEEDIRNTDFSFIIN